METLRIDGGRSLEKECIELIPMNPLNGIILNYQPGRFISELCMWYFDLRHQRHLVDG